MLIWYAFKTKPNQNQIHAIMLEWKLSQVTQII